MKLKLLKYKKLFYYKISKLIFFLFLFLNLIIKYDKILFLNLKKKK